MKRSVPIIIFVVCFAYAVIRYNVFKGVDYDLIPSYILNKALSFTSLILFALTFLPRSIFDSFKSIDKSANKRSYSLYAYGMSVLHLIITLLIISPEHYPKFYSGGAFNMIGVFTLVLGSLSIFVFTMPFLASFSRIRQYLFKSDVQRIFSMAKLAYVLSVGHVITMGFSGWFDITAWPASLPPITLLAFLVSMICLSTTVCFTLFHAYQRKTKRAA